MYSVHCTLYSGHICSVGAGDGDVGGSGGGGIKCTSNSSGSGVDGYHGDY